MPTGPKGQRRSADAIGNAVKVMRIATEEEPEDYGPAKPEKNEAADALVRAAHEDVAPSPASAMQDHTRRYRVVVLELQGRLATLSDNYARRFHTEV